MVMVDERPNTRSNWVNGEARARTRYLPASTFKVPHALVALDVGVVRDEFQVLRWVGTRHDIETWNHDQERRYLRRINYGNADPSGGVDRF